MMKKNKNNNSDRNTKLKRSYKWPGVLLGIIILIIFGSIINYYFINSEHPRMENRALGVIDIIPKHNEILTSVPDEVVILTDRPLMGPSELSIFHNDEIVGGEGGNFSEKIMRTSIFPRAGSFFNPVRGLYTIHYDVCYEGAPCNYGSFQFSVSK